MARTREERFLDKLFRAKRGQEAWRTTSAIGEVVIGNPPSLEYVYLEEILKAYKKQGKIRRNSNG